MPAIDAATVAEHRAHQREALLDAAEALLREDGPRGLTFGALGDRPGLARNSVYRYFADADDVVAALCERELPGWMAAVETAMADAPDLPARTEAFVVAQLELVHGGGHRLADLLGGTPLAAPARARIAALAHRPAVLLEAELAAAGDPDPAVTAQLVQGLVGAAIRQLHAGADAERVVARAARLARRALTPDGA